MRPDNAQPRQRHRGPGTADRAGAEPEPVPAPASLLEPLKAQPLSLPLPLLRCDEAPQRPVQIPERLLVDALRVLRPPGQRRIGLLPGVPQLVQLHSRIPAALRLVALLAPGQPPVPGEPGRAGMRTQHALACRGRVQGEPVLLDHPRAAVPRTAARRTHVLIMAAGSDIPRGPSANLTPSPPPGQATPTLTAQHHQIRCSALLLTQPTLRCERRTAAPSLPLRSA